MIIQLTEAQIIILNQKQAQLQLAKQAMNEMLSVIVAGHADPITLKGCTCDYTGKEIQVLPPAEGD